MSLPKILQNSTSTTVYPVDADDIMTDLNYLDQRIDGIYQSGADGITQITIPSGAVTVTGAQYIPGATLSVTLSGTTTMFLTVSSYVAVNTIFGTEPSACNFSIRVDDVALRTYNVGPNSSIAVPLSFWDTLVVEPGLHTIGIYADNVSTDWNILTGDLKVHY